MSEFIGVIIGAITGKVYAVINPDDDSELDNPKFLLLTAFEPDAREPMAMAKMPRSDYAACSSLSEVANLAARMAQ